MSVIQKSILNVVVILAGALVAVVFVTSRTYSQIIFGVLLYVPLAYFSYQVFLRRGFVYSPVRGSKPKTGDANGSSYRLDKREVEVVDFDRRAFIKLLGGVGLTFFVFSLFSRRADSFLFGEDSGTPPPLPGSGTGVPVPTEPQDLGESIEGFRISEVDDEGEFGFYGFVNAQGAWFVMQEDASEGKFRYARGTEDFMEAWKNRVNLNYGYFHELF